ncbi:hypothetical protein OpiT1DRAFT_03754 [Opitutaceae bacterium TAV1]|nr:hypothetical protein OpiT1DRAFT_03754 [Opitutaceae bacterium TAV1]
MTQGSPSHHRRSRHALRFRQVHLDFHTHGSIPGVGARFDKRAFQDALQEARVDSITCFSKCHHGWSYHDTAVGRRHPHLARELLAEQIEACREIGVRVPIYLSAGFDELAIDEHPEWLVVNRQGVAHDPFQAGWRGFLRWNSGYLDYLCRQIEEVVTRWRDADGIFLDIVGAWHDYSDTSLAEMRRTGRDPENETDVAAHAKEALLCAYKRMSAAARIHNTDINLFFNDGHVGVGTHDIMRFNSHLELESLPTGGWGYDHFPLSARYAITTGFEFVGMTGKFHTAWGEFGGFKRPAALRYECEAMISLGAKCSVGDQLHPCGEINRDTYSLIGDAYREVERKEAWCGDVTPVARIGLVSTCARNSPADEGAARMLLELHLPFLVLDREAPWDAAAFDVIVLPDEIRLEPGSGGLLEKARAYLTGGGRILASGTSLLDEDGQRAALDEAGIRFPGRSGFEADYLVAGDVLPEVPVRSPIVIHGGAVEAELLSGTQVLARRARPYFNRTWEHFCSHQHAPDVPEANVESEVQTGPGATLSATGNVAWFAHRIFTRYRLYGQPLYRDFVRAVLSRLLNGNLPVLTSLPSTGRVSLMEQRGQGRYVLHLLHAVPVLKGGTGTGAAGENARAVEVIEEVLPVQNVRCLLRLPQRVKSVRLVPDGDLLPFRQKEGKVFEVSFTVPEVHGHQMVEIGWAN